MVSKLDPIGGPTQFSSGNCRGLFRHVAEGRATRSRGNGASEDWYDVLDCRGQRVAA